MSRERAELVEADLRRQVLRVCLGEIRRCRLFLLVLLGDRSGWVPPAGRIAAAARGALCGESAAYFTDD